MDKQLEKISKSIKMMWPGAQVSVIKGERDHVGPVLSVRNKSLIGLDVLSRSPEHIVVEIDARDDNHVLVIPLGHSGSQIAMGA